LVRTLEARIDQNRSFDSSINDTNEFDDNIDAIDESIDDIITVVDQKNGWKTLIIALSRTQSIVDR
jgi:hypothetical protein